MPEPTKQNPIKAAIIVGFLLYLLHLLVSIFPLSSLFFVAALSCVDSGCNSMFGLIGIVLGELAMILLTYFVFHKSRSILKRTDWKFPDISLVIAFFSIGILMYGGILALPATMGILLLLRKIPAISTPITSPHTQWEKYLGIIFIIATLVSTFIFEVYLLIIASASSNGLYFINALPFLMIAVIALWQSSQEIRNYLGFFAWSSPITAFIIAFIAGLQTILITNLIHADTLVKTDKYNHPYYQFITGPQLFLPIFTVVFVLLFTFYFLYHPLKNKLNQHVLNLILVIVIALTIIPVVQLLTTRLVNTAAPIEKKAVQITHSANASSSFYFAPPTSASVIITQENKDSYEYWGGIRSYMNDDDTFRIFEEKYKGGGACTALGTDQLQSVNGKNKNECPLVGTTDTGEEIHQNERDGSIAVVFANQTKVSMINLRIDGKPYTKTEDMIAYIKKFQPMTYEQINKMIDKNNETLHPRGPGATPDLTNVLRSTNLSTPAPR